MRRSSFAAGKTVVCLVSILVVTLLLSNHGQGQETTVDKSVSQQPASDLDTRIAQLIQQLGAPEYATRQKARTELERLRLDAFDALNEAQFNDDIEVALTPATWYAACKLTGGPKRTHRK